RATVPIHDGSPVESSFEPGTFQPRSRGPSRVPDSTQLERPRIENRSTELCREDRAACTEPKDCRIIDSVSNAINHQLLDFQSTEEWKSKNCFWTHKTFTPTHHYDAFLLLSNPSDLNQISSMRSFAFITSNTKSGR
ncbi:hypothetical protein AVEN_231702-1, partial [Araneus ventricosus]